MLYSVVELFGAFSLEQNIEINPSVNLRKHVRIPVRWQVEITLPGKKEPSYTGVTENVSSSGVGLLLQDNLSNNIKAHLRFSAMIRGISATFDAIVMIRHVSLSGSAYRCGCLFLKLSDSRREMIEQMVDDYLRRQDALRVA